MALLQNDYNEQASPMTEGVAEIRINIHMWAMKAPWVAMVHDDYQRIKLDPPYPSVGLPRDTAMSIRECPPHYPIVHPLNMVGCRPTQWLSKQLCLQDPITQYAPVHNQSCSPGLVDRSSIGIGGGYHLWMSEQENRPLSSFPSSPLSPSCPALSHIESQI
jgi:hypothetical protein